MTQSSAAEPLTIGERPTDLARTLRRLVEAEKASSGGRNRGLRLVADFFYRGPLARELDAWSRASGGLLRYSDLATHVTRVEEPASVDYRGHVAYKCGPWTQGPYLLQTLRLLQGFDVKAMGHNRPDSIHHAVESMKLALADRDVYYADPLFVDVPLAELLSPRTDRLAGPSKPVANGVRAIEPVGMKGMRNQTGLPLSKRPMRHGRLRGSLVWEGPNGA